MTQAVAIPNREQQMAVLTAMGLNPNHPATTAIILISEKYGLAAELGHLQIVEGKPYVTHAGLLHIAHASRQLDGINTLVKLVDEKTWVAQCSVWRKDMSHPFVYEGFCAKSENVQAAIGHRERAIIRAERKALKRAFAIAVAVAGEDPGEDFDTPNDAPLSSNGDTRPALPSGPAVAIATPDAAPPAESAVAQPPPGVDPETGEVDEKLRELQQATGQTEPTGLQKRAAEIAEKAQEKEAEPAPEKPKRTRRTKAQIEADKAKAAGEAEGEFNDSNTPPPANDPYLDDDEPTDAEVVEDLPTPPPPPPTAESPQDPKAAKRTQRLAIAAGKAELDEETEDQLIDLVTEGRTTSKLEVTEDEADDLELLYEAIQFNRVELSFDNDGFVTVDPMPVNWKRVATVHSITEAKILRKAREVATAWGVPVPSMTKEITDQDLVDEMMTWVKTFPPHS